MDYKYIEQLIERYWDCNSTQLEEQILQTFFSQNEIPEHLQKYRSVFTAVSDVKEAHLGKEFDDKIISKIHYDCPTAVGQKPVKAIRLSMWKKFRPLYQAAAMVAIVLSIGMATQHSFTGGDSIMPEATAGNQVEDPDSQYTLMPEGMTNSSAINDKVSEDTMENIIAPSTSNTSTQN